MKVLLTGANGQLGKALCTTVPDQIELIAADRSRCDISRFESVASIASQHQPDLIINAAAYTAVDQAESETAAAYAINEQGVTHLAAVAKKIRARLIHISTDFVFDGEQSHSYLPSDATNPTSVYGASKRAGEVILQQQMPTDSLIIRTAWVYSADGSNFVNTMLRLMASQPQLTVVTDQIGTPTWAKKLAQVIWQFSQQPSASGIYHWTDTGVASWYDFAVAIQEEALDCGLLKHAIPIIPVTSEHYPTAAKRPPFSVLNKTSSLDLLPIEPQHWRHCLRQMLREKVASNQPSVSD